MALQDYFTHFEPNKFSSWRKNYEGRIIAIRKQNLPFPLVIRAELEPDNWAAAWQNQQNELCALQKLRSAWAESSLSARRPWVISYP